jgi:hypothetical protein
MDGKHLFADGNVETGFESFETDHTCNKFCRWFRLRTDYDNWGPAPSTSGESTVMDLTNMDISVGDSPQVA